MLLILASSKLLHSGARISLIKILTQLVEIGPRQKKFNFRFGLKFLLNPNGMVLLPRLELFKG